VGVRVEVGVSVGADVAVVVGVSVATGVFVAVGPGGDVGPGVGVPVDTGVARVNAPSTTGPLESDGWVFRDDVKDAETTRSPNPSRTTQMPFGDASSWNGTGVGFGTGVAVGVKGPTGRNDVVVGKSPQLY
jgi:hypothetical protein